MRETARSLQIYFMMIAVASFLAADGRSIATHGLAHGLFVLVGLLLALLTFIAGVRMTAWLHTRARFLYAIVTAQMVLQWIGSLGDTLDDHLSVHLGAWVLWLRPGFALVIGLYLLWNVRRLSGTMTPAPPR